MRPDALDWIIFSSKEFDGCVILSEGSVCCLINLKILYLPISDCSSVFVHPLPEQYHLNNSAYGPFGQGLPHPHSNHSTVGLNKYTSLKAVGKLATDTHTHKMILTPTDTVTFKLQ